MTGVLTGADGSVFLTGTIQPHLSTLQQPVITRMSADGVVDTAFGTNGTVTLPQMPAGGKHAVAVLDDGRLLVAASNATGLVVRRLTTTGAVDTSFGVAGEALRPHSGVLMPSIVQVLADGRGLVAATSLRQKGGGSYEISVVLGRFSAAGVRDTTFNPAYEIGTNYLPEFTARLIRLLPGGGVKVSCTMDSSKLMELFYNADGVWESTRTPYLGQGFVQWIPAMVAHADGSTTLLASGSNPSTSVNSFFLMRITESGTLDPSVSSSPLRFNYPGPLADRSYLPLDLVARESDGRLFVTGLTGASYAGSLDRGFVMRFGPDGQPDATFNGNGRAILSPGVGGAEASRIRLLGNDRLLVAGRQRASADDATFSSYGVTRLGAGEQGQDVPPEIVSSPVDAMYSVPGPTLQLKVMTAPNELVPAFRWYRNNTLVAGQSGNQLAINTVAQAGTYRVEAYNAAGVATAPPFTITVKAPPQVSATTWSKSGGQLVLRVTVTGAPPFTVQWQLHGLPYGDPVMGSGTAPTFTLPYSPGYTGSWNAVVTNADGSATSQPVYFEPDPSHPIVTVQPRPATTDLRQGEIRLQVQVKSTAVQPLTYQWQKDYVNFGASQTTTAFSHTLFLPSHPNANGVYRCIVSNAAGWTASETAQVKVNDTPSLQVDGAAYRLVSLGEPLNIAATVHQVHHSSLQWTHGNRAFSGKTLYTPLSGLGAAGIARLEIPRVSNEDAGVYRLRGRNDANLPVESIPVTVGVVVGAGSYQRSTLAGKTVTLSAYATGPGLQYQWKRDDGRPVTGKRYSGQKTRTLKITRTAPEDTGEWYCEVSFAKVPGSPVVVAHSTRLAVVTARPVLITTSLPSGRQSTSYEAPVTFSPGTDAVMVSGLPAGLEYVSYLGKIVGSPRESGTFAVRFSMSNLKGTSLPVELPLFIEPNEPEPETPFIPVGDYSGVMGGDPIKVKVAVSASGVFTGRLEHLYPGGVVQVESFTGQRTQGSAEIFEGTSGGFVMAGRSGFQKVQIVWPEAQSPQRARLVCSLIGDNGQVWASCIVYARPMSEDPELVSSHAGYHTLELEPEFYMPDSQVPNPGGSGYAGLTVQPDGSFTCTGKLSDNSAFTFSGIIFGDGQSAGDHVWINQNRGYLYLLLTVGRSQPGLLPVRVGGDGGWHPSLSGSGTFLKIQGSSYVPPGTPGVTTPYVLNASAPGAPVRVTLNEKGGEGFVLNGVVGAQAQITFPGPPPLQPPYTITSLNFDPATGVFSGEGLLHMDPSSSSLRVDVPATFQGMVIRPDVTSANSIGRGYVQPLGWRISMRVME